MAEFAPLPSFAAGTSIGSCGWTAEIRRRRYRVGSAPAALERQVPRAAPLGSTLGDGTVERRSGSHLVACVRNVVAILQEHLYKGGEQPF